MPSTAPCTSISRWLPLGSPPPKSTSSSPRTCTSITPADSRRAARRDRASALPACPLHRSPRRVGRRHAPARAEPGELLRRELRAAVETSGQLTLVDDDAEVTPGVRTVRTGGHTHSSDRADRVGRTHGRVHGRPDPDRRRTCRWRGSWATTSIRWTPCRSSAPSCPKRPRTNTSSSSSTTPRVPRVTSGRAGDRIVVENDLVTGVGVKWCDQRAVLGWPGVSCSVGQSRERPRRRPGRRSGHARRDWHHWRERPVRHGRPDGS